MAEQLYENNLEYCAKSFFGRLSEKDYAVIKNSDFEEAEIKKIFKKLGSKDLSDQFFAEKMTLLLKQLSNISKHHSTLLLVDLLKKNDLEIPQSLGDTDEVTRTILRLSCLENKKTYQEEQILSRHELTPGRPYVLRAKQVITNLDLLANNLSQPKSPPVGEGNPISLGPMKV